MRETGSDPVGSVSWGTHFCIFYQTKADLRDILVPYFKAGLENNEFCMWVTSEPLPVEEAKRSLREAVKNLDEYIENGQMEIIDYRQWYTKSGIFDADEVLRGWVDKEEQALGRGFAGLRLSGNTFWLEKEDWGAFADYEATVDRVLGNCRIIAACPYSLDRCGASEIIDVVYRHRFALIKREGEWKVIESDERKLAEEALRESEERFRRLYERAPLGYQSLDTEGCFIDVNQAWLDLLGYSRDQIIGHWFGDFLAPQELDAFKERFPRFKATGEVHVDLEMVQRAGSRIIVHIDGKTGRDEHGQFKQTHCILHDITERKRTDRLLHLQHGLAVALSSASQLKEGARLCLQAALNISGLDCGGLYLVDKASGALNLLVHQGLSSDFVKAVAHYAADSANSKLVMAGKPVYAGHPALGVPLGEAERREGLRIVAVVPVSHQGQVIGCFNLASHAVGEVPALAQEMLETVVAQTGSAIARLQAEEALRDQETRYRRIVTTAREGIWMRDAEAKTSFVNQRMAEMLGYSVEEMLGRSVFDFMDEADREEMERHFGQRKQGVVDQYDFRFRRKDGSDLWTIVSANPLFDDNDQFIGALGMITDITERKRAEAELERLLGDLEAKNRELESFVSTISHDLKSPLVSLDGFSHALQKACYEQLGEKGRHYLERIRANVTDMNALIARLLELSRIGQVIGPIEEVDVAALLRDIRDKLAAGLEKARAEFIVQEPLPTVRADRGRIHQVFVNLIDNTIKFRSAERALRIEVGCRQEGDFYRFHVADNGIGVAPQYHEQIFAHFRKLHPEIEGVGMGLALVKKIVEHHGGRVWVRSPSAWLRGGDEGTGATFYFTLPIECGIEPHDRSPKPEGLS